MAYYDRIAKQWHRVTGYSGGSLKRHILNDRIIACIGSVDDVSILEVGAGNGYFMPLVMKRFSGQIPRRLVISDASQRLLDIVQTSFAIPDAEYMCLDIRKPLPLAANSFDLILATMVFNEINTSGLNAAFEQFSRVLRTPGRIIATVTHPDFIESLSRRGQIRKQKGYLSMPGAKGLRLPVVVRTVDEYLKLFHWHGFNAREEGIYPSQQVLRDKPGLAKAGNIPIAAIFVADKMTMNGGKHDND